MLPQRLFSLISSSSMRKIVPTTWLTAPSSRVPQASEWGIRMISSDNSKIASYTDVKEIGRNGLLIDVREPQELQETGILPNSINIPLAQVEAAFKDLSDDEFMKKYGRNKPTVQTSLVFSCKMGVRSDTAMKIVEKIGYSNVRNYKGGWVDWEQQQQEQQQNKH